MLIQRSYLKLSSETVIVKRYTRVRNWLPYFTQRNYLRSQDWANKRGGYTFSSITVESSLLVFFAVIG